MQKELLVIQEYRNAMDRFKSDDPSYKNGACIVGQPGIGKSIFIAYAVIERLRDRQPVAVQVLWRERSDAYILFAKDGVTIHGRTDPALENHVPDLWAFSDSNVVAEIPTSAFITTPAVRVFQTASPAEKRWKNWTKERQVQLYVMDLWSVEEIMDLVFISKYEGNATERIKTLSRTLVTSLVSHERERSNKAIVDNIVVQAVKDPDAITRAVLDLDNAVPGSSTIFFVRPLRERDTIVRSIHTVYIPTPWLVRNLAAELNCQQAAKKMEFFHTLCAYSRTRSAAGWIFEEIMHHFLVHVKSITVHWHEECPEILQLRLLDLTTNADLCSPTPFYWRPGNPTNPGIDGAIITKTHVYLILATISREHPNPQKSVDKLWQSMPQDKKALEWRLLFIGPVDDQTYEVSVKYTRGLEVGDKQMTQQGGILNNHLQVGRFSLFPNILEFMHSELFTLS